jgi:hypothetical protein
MHRRAHSYLTTTRSAGPAQVLGRVFQWVGVIIFEVVVETVWLWHRENRNTKK